MKSSLPALLLVAAAAAKAFFTVSIYAPQYPQVHGRCVNARDRRFIIGADTPSTYCGRADNRECPPGDKTLIDRNMTSLAASVPGGQFIYVSPMGSISYPKAHSSLRPPGSKIGGFQQAMIVESPKLNISVLFWEPENGFNGLWACPTSPYRPIEVEAELKATTNQFLGYGCVPVLAVQIRDAGNEFAAWAYT